MKGSPLGNLAQSTSRFSPLTPTVEDRVRSQGTNGSKPTKGPPAAETRKFKRKTFVAVQQQNHTEGPRLSVEVAPRHQSPKRYLSVSELQLSQSVSSGQSVSSAVSTASSSSLNRQRRTHQRKAHGDCCGALSDWWTNKFMGRMIGQKFLNDKKQLVANSDSFTFGSAPSTNSSQLLRQDRYSGRVELTPACCSKDVAGFMAGVNGQPKRITQITPISKIPTMMRQVEMDCSVLGSSSSSGDDSPPPSQLFYQEYQRRKNSCKRAPAKFGSCPA